MTMVTSKARERACKLCEGTGFLYLMNSWFHHGGYRRSRCGICGGTGKSNYNPGSEYVAQMKRIRDLASQHSLQHQGDK